MKPSALCLLSVALASVLLSGCGSGAGGVVEDPLFPLSPAWEWHYQTKKTTDEGVQHGEYLIENTGVTAHFEERYLTRRDIHGTRFYFQRDDSGVYRVGKQTLVARDIALDPKPRYVLPAPLEVDKIWFVDSHPYVLQRVSPVRETFTRQNVFQMTYSIVSVDAEVEVPAGTFSGCVQVRATGTATVLADLAKGRYGASDAEITTDEWYAPGVGLVKLVRTEVFPNELFADGSYEMELLEVRKP